MKNYKTRIECECDGAGPCVGNETRLYPTGGGGNLILCEACFRREARFNEERGNDLMDWSKAKSYKKFI